MIRSSIAAIVTISITVALFSTSASADSAYNDAAFTFHRNGNTYQRLNLINQQHPQHLQQHLQQQHINGHYNFILQQQKQNKHISSSSLYASFHLNPLPDKLKKLRLPTFSKNVFRRSNRGNLPTSATTCLNQAMSDDDSNSSSRNSKNNDDKTNMEDSNTMELGGGVNGSATTSTVEAPSVLVTSNEEEHDMKNGVIDPNPFLTATTTEHISKNGKTPSDIEGTGSMEPSDSEVETMNGEYEAFNGNEVNGNTNGELIENVDEYEYVDESVMEQSELSRKVVEEIVSPIFGPEIEKGVSQDTIKGALVAGATLTFVTNNFNLNVAAAVALWTAYVSITPGQPGNVARVFGDAAWESTKTVLKASRNLAKALGIRLPFVNTKRSNEDQPALMGKEEIQLDDEIANLVQEVEDTVAEVESVLSDTNAAREAAAEAEQMTEDEAERLAEEARMLELEYLLEEAQIERRL